ncbi:MAG: carboxymuconolactone decarboxylase family protein [Actinomycetota bacterium]
MPLSARQQEVKDEFIGVRGTWSDVWESILVLDEDYLLAYLDFSAVPFRQNHLDAKTKEFIFITVDSAATHLFVPGIRAHIRAALAVGASQDEIMEVLECTSTLGIHAMNVGVPILLDVLTERGDRTGPAELDAEQQRIKAAFTANRGYWNPTWDEMLEVDPHLFEAYSTFSSVPWKHGHLSPLTKELIYIAFDTAATHLYRVGLKLHIENALGYGATPQQILEVMEIASVIGVHSVMTSAPILLEEVAAFEKEGNK